MTKYLKYIVNIRITAYDKPDMNFVNQEVPRILTQTSICGSTSIEPIKAKKIDKTKIIKQLLNKKAEENNTIDLDAYTLGLQDAFNNIYDLKNEKS